jgi:hypothetical protein
VYANGKYTSYTFVYYVLKVSDAEAVTPEAFIGATEDVNGYWGRTGGK